MTDSRLQIRRALPADAAALSAFAARTFVETFGPDNDADDMRAYLESSYGLAQQGRELSDPTYVTLLAHHGERLAAYAQLQRGAPPPACVTEPDPVELHRFYVDRPWHGRGVARELMAAVRATARQMGGRTLWLGVWEHNPRAIAFYSKAGFVDVGSTGFLLGAAAQTDRVMMVRLDVATLEESTLDADRRQ